MKLHYVDCCDGSYLQDHHNRDGEQMLIVHDPNDCTPADIQEALLDDLDMIADEEFSDEQYKAAKEAIRQFFRDNPEFNFGDGPFGEDCHGWFFLKWG